MFISFFVGASIFILLFGVFMSALFHLYENEIHNSPDGVQVGIVLVLFGMSMLLGAVASAGVN